MLDEYITIKMEALERKTLLLDRCKEMLEINIQRQESLRRDAQILRAQNSLF